VIFDFFCTISRKWCKIEPRSQLITNKKSYMSFRLEQKSVTLSDLEGYQLLYLGNEARLRLITNRKSYMGF